MPSSTLHAPARWRRGAETPEKCPVSWLSRPSPAGFPTRSVLGTQRTWWWLGGGLGELEGRPLGADVPTQPCPFRAHRGCGAASCRRAPLAISTLTDVFSEQTGFSSSFVVVPLRELVVASLEVTFVIQVHSTYILPCMNSALILHKHCLLYSLCIIWKIMKLV